MVSTETKQSAPWWVGEDAVRVSCIARHVPGYGDAPLSKATVYAWTDKGIRGIVLRRFRSGGVWCTTRQEIARWQEALTDAEQ